MNTPAFSSTNPLPSSTLLIMAASSSTTSAASDPRNETPQLAPGGPPPPPPFSHNASYVYRPDLLPSSLYAPLPPYPSHHPVGPGGRALRRLGPQEGAEPYHSAFTPAAKKKAQDEAASGCSLSSSSLTSSSSSSSSAVYSAAGGDDRSSFQIKGKGELSSAEDLKEEERPSSNVSSAGGETISENGDTLDRATPDSSEGRMLRKSRKRTLDGPLPCCPVCGLTLRPGDSDAHLAMEVDKVDRILRGGRKSRDSTPSGKKTFTSPSVKKGKDSPGPDAASKARFESFRMIRSNRQSRLNARSRHKKRRTGEELECPVCNERMVCTAEELTLHVDLCLKKKEQGEEEDDTILDVEGEEDGGTFEEYEWAGQTRVRTTSLLERGFGGLGMQTSSSKELSDEDVDLDVDGDDTEEYGKPQFTESDLIPISDGDFYPDEQHRELTKAMTVAIQKEAVPTLSSLSGEPTPSTSHTDSDGGGGMSGGDQGPVVAALKARLKDLEKAQDNQHKCLICLNQYEEPVVSVLCWHVHCRSCWQQTLGAKKLCPQCNVITPMAKLRRIYL